MQAKFQRIKGLGKKIIAEEKIRCIFLIKWGQVNISSLCFLHANQGCASSWLLFCSRDFQTQLCQHDLILIGSSSSPWFHQCTPCVKYLWLLVVLLLTAWNFYPKTSHPETDMFHHLFIPLLWHHSSLEIVQTSVDFSLHLNWEQACIYGRNLK